MNRQFFNMLANKSQSVEPVEVHALKFEGTEVFTLSVNAKNWNGTVEYSTNGTVWTEWDGSEIGGNTVLYLRGTGNNRFASSTSEYTTFTFNTNGYISAIGKIEYLLDYEKISIGEEQNMWTYCFYSLFSNCSVLKTTPEITSTTLNNFCYDRMFFGCTELSSPATFNAITLGNYCCRYMYGNCTGIKVSKTKTDNYDTEWKIPANGSISEEATSWSINMLNSTGGAFTGSPSINTTYYLDVS